MQNIPRKLAALAIAGTLITPTTITAAHAQSSFGSSFLDSGSSTVDFKSPLMERTFESFLKRVGEEISPEAESRAEDLLQRALDGEFTYDGGAYGYPYEDGYGSIDQLTEAEFDTYLALLEVSTERPDYYPDGITWGVAVGKSGDYYYMALVNIYDEYELVL